jgi:hypothetical protein
VRDDVVARALAVVGGHVFLMAAWDFATSSPFDLNHSMWSKSMNGCRQSVHSLDGSSALARFSQAEQRP